MLSTDSAGGLRLFFHFCFSPKRGDLSTHSVGYAEGEFNICNWLMNRKLISLVFECNQFDLPGFRMQTRRKGVRTTTREFSRK